MNELYKDKKLGSAPRRLSGFTWHLLRPLLGLLIVCTACEEDTTSDNAGSDKWSELGPYAAVSYLGESMFLGVIDSLAMGVYDQSGSYEIEGMYSINYYNRKLHVPPSLQGGGTSVHVYKVGDDNVLTAADDIIDVPSGSGPGGILFVSETKAYLPLAISGHILEFNPSTFEVTDDIDLQKYAVGAEDASEDDNSPEPGSMAIREGKLYVALSQAYNSMMTGRPIVQVAVLDAETHEVEKVISESESGLTMPGSMEESRGNFFVDENGDLYVGCKGSWGWVEGHKSGYLRIKSDETAFDSTWKMDFSEYDIDVTGGKIDYLQRAIYAGDGIVYGVAHVPGAEGDPVDWIHDRCYSYVKVDLRNQTVETIALPSTTAYSADLLIDGDYLIASGHTDEGTGIYVLDMSTGEVVGNPALETQGDVTTLRKID